MQQPNANTDKCTFFNMQKQKNNFTEENMAIWSSQKPKRPRVGWNFANSVNNQSINTPNRVRSGSSLSINAYNEKCNKVKSKEPLHKKLHHQSMNLYNKLESSYIAQNFNKLKEEKYAISAKKRNQTPSKNFITRHLAKSSERYNSEQPMKNAKNGAQSNSNKLRKKNNKRIIEASQGKRGDAKATLTEYSLWKRNSDPKEEILKSSRKSSIPESTKNTDNKEEMTKMFNFSNLNDKIVKKYTEDWCMKMRMRPPSINTNSNDDMKDWYPMHPIFSHRLNNYSSRGSTSQEKRSISSHKLLLSSINEGYKTNKSMHHIPRPKDLQMKPLATHNDQWPTAHYVLTPATPVKREYGVRGNFNSKSNTRLLPSGGASMNQGKDEKFPPLFDLNKGSATRINEFAEKAGFRLPRSLSQPRNPMMANKLVQNKTKSVKSWNKLQGVNQKGEFDKSSGRKLF